ncbi:MAG: hypothetical protein U1F34_09715 [Gammaproteobacteria bacterium]
MAGIAVGSSATATQSTSSTSGGFSLFGGKGISFMDVLKVLGGGLIGGPVGAALSFAGVIAEKAFTKDDDANNSAANTADAAGNPNTATNAQPLADNTSGVRPGGWMINMAYGARDPYQAVSAPNAVGDAPSTAIASTSINDPRLHAGAGERPGGWIINAAYGYLQGAGAVGGSGASLDARV